MIKTKLNIVTAVNYLSIVTMRQDIYMKQNECPKCKLKILSCYNIWQIICQLEIYQNEIAFL